MKKERICDLVVRELSLDVVKPDEEIIRIVLEKFAESKINRDHLAWYKVQFKQGRYHEGLSQKLNQPVRSTEVGKSKGLSIQTKIERLQKRLAELQAQ